jgi:hypothetical protein
MLTTYELRWFYPGRIPENIAVWFKQNCLIEPLQPPEERSDIYLYSPESDFMGIKLRQGRLEVKWRKAELGTVYFGKFAEGKAQKWGKWFCCDSTQESFQPKTVLDKPSWVSVEKMRYLQLYQFIPNSSPAPVSTQESIDNGCSVELTQLVIRDRIWWSLAFEASGEEACMMDNLQATAYRVFNTYPESKLLAVNSYAYPTWLALVCQ